jgi:DNA replicative helicase MCM subunit Mcm2 (Cdc46/Mcm family)
MIAGVVRVKPFLVFKCAKCRNFTNAPVGQKKRRCSYCGKIIDISKARKAVFDTPEQATAAVKRFNASRGGDEFDKAVEKSRARVLSLMPPEEIRAKDIADDTESEPSQGKRRTLISLLQKEAADEPCTLDRMEELCTSAGLEWNWVEKQFQSLSNSGQMIFPRPWTIQYVVEKKKRVETAEGRSRDVTLEILALLSEKGKRVSIHHIIEHFKQRGISQESVESSLEKLMRNGDIYEPRTGHVCLL